jgi:hypothetical protein
MALIANVLLQATIEDKAIFLADVGIAGAYRCRRGFVGVAAADLGVPCSLAIEKVLPEIQMVAPRKAC